MGWNYRVFRIQPEKSSVPYLAIYEVYYSEAGVPHSTSAEPLVLMQENVQDLETTLEMVSGALKKPILEWDGTKIAEVQNDESYGK